MYKPQPLHLLWLKEHVDYDGPDCLIWPWSRFTTGYGQVGIDRKVHGAHRVMCELVNGPPPTPAHQAGHSCGLGHDACVHPKHLSWKTKSENRRDREQHRRKIKNFRYKLTPEQAEEIRKLAGTMTNTALAAKYGVSRGCVRQIIKGETWLHGWDPKGTRAKAARMAQA